MFCPRYRNKMSEESNFCASKKKGLIPKAIAVVIAVLVAVGIYSVLLDGSIPVFAGSDNIKMEERQTADIIPEAETLAETGDYAALKDLMAKSQIMTADDVLSAALANIADGAVSVRRKIKIEDFLPVSMPSIEPFNIFEHL